MNHKEQAKIVVWIQIQINEINNPSSYKVMELRENKHFIHYLETVQWYPLSHSIHEHLCYKQSHKFPFDQRSVVVDF